MYFGLLLLLLLHAAQPLHSHAWPVPYWMPGCAGGAVMSVRVAAFAALLCRGHSSAGGKAAASAPAPAAVVPAVASLATTPVCETDPAFVGATIDWWRENDPTYGPKFGLGGALVRFLFAPPLTRRAGLHAQRAPLGQRKAGSSGL
jgi:hypothetical protein